MKKNNEEQDRDLEAAVNLIKHIRNFYEAIPPVMQQMCTEAILDAAGEMQKNGDLKPAAKPSYRRDRSAFGKNLQANWKL